MTPKNLIKAPDKGKKEMTLIIKGGAVDQRNDPVRYKIMYGPSGEKPAPTKPNLKKFMIWGKLKTQRSE